MEPIKATELTKKLQELINEHGDHPVFSIVDYDFASDVEYREDVSELLGSEKRSGFVIT